jgi:hypothetical protein
MKNFTLVLAATCLLGLGSQRAFAQSLSYTSGQPIFPAYEGWEENPDGSKSFVFGYMNRNWEEELDIPVGANNSFNLGTEDRGQPTHFLPRRNRFVFRVPVPKEFTEKDELIWTLSSRGRTERAFATLRPDYKLDNVTEMSETGALGAGTSSPEIRANKRPSVKLEAAKPLTVKVNQPLTLVAWVTDDGVPKARTGASVGSAPRPTRPANLSPAAPRNPLLIPPSRVTVGKRVGLHLSWFVYRAPVMTADAGGEGWGEGRAMFDPPQIKVWEETRTGAESPWAPLWVPPPVPADGKYSTQVRFDTPGTYVLRARADDGALYDDQDVTVIVTR